MPGSVKTNMARDSMHEGNRPDNPVAVQMLKAWKLFADLSSEQAADWIIDAIKKDQHRVLVGYDGVLLDKLSRTFPYSLYDVYAQMGREGMSGDLFDQTGTNFKKL